MNTTRTFIPPVLIPFVTGYALACSILCFPVMLRYANICSNHFQHIHKLKPALSTRCIGSLGFLWYAQFYNHELPTFLPDNERTFGTN